jgi:hypothetical protein
LSDAGVGSVACTVTDPFVVAVHSSSHFPRFPSGPPSARRHLFRLGWVLGFWGLVQARTLRAENAVSYKYEDYRESDGRISVQSHYGLIEQDLGPDMHVKLEGVIDAIAGATPTGQPPATPGGPVPLTELSDRRKAWSADFSRQFPRVNVALGFANSRESDYVSNGWSLNTLTDFHEKNTVLLLGAAGTDDDAKVLYQTPTVKKRGLDFIAGITQLLDPRTTVTLNLGYGHSSGYMADPYRVIGQRTQIDPGPPPVFLPLTYGENRPEVRDKWTVYATVNRAFPGLRSALEAGYRFYHDSFGTNAHTLDLAWFYKLGSHVVLRPEFRFYDQSAADFYRLTLDGADFTPTGRPDPDGPFFSADYRLSAFRATTLGFKAIWTVNASWQLDAAIERYRMHGKDSVTSPSAYPDATIATFGVKFSW